MGANSHSFKMPPAARTPAELDSFLEGAPDRKNNAPSPAPAPSAASTTALPWEGQTDQRRSPVQPLRLTLAEQAMVEFVVGTKVGVKSKHAYMLEVLQRALKADIKDLIGEDVEFGDSK
ncbi:hypothetical protein [Xanthomonas citri]|uniref:hypothetical protein n=1 Tax=Xanthomonas citri TaxID=346 RepID=UPI000CCF48B9|nr:hypothetical protein [Xanthomonas citri]PNV26512.1 hypothetical protein xavtCFBP7764_23335 [Xanthomonas citri]